jgi:Protein of unknown function (DUF2799)
MRSAKSSLVLAALLLGGCASMNEAECVSVDWQTVGFEDGVAGYSGDRIGQHRKACAKHGVSPDLSAYQQGREAGLREFCQPANGFRVGSSGGGYAGVCPADLSAPFSAAYESGRQLHVLESRVSTANSQLASKRRELERIEDNVVKKTALIVAGDSTNEERAQALVDMKQMTERAGRLKAEIIQLERDKVAYERDLEDYRARVAFAG